jgi:hypothetical protein
MVHDDDAVPRQVDVELEPVGAERETMVECGERVLGPQGGAATVRIDERNGKRLRQRHILPTCYVLRATCYVPFAFALFPFPFSLSGAPQPV